MIQIWLLSVKLVCVAGSEIFGQGAVIAILYVMDLFSSLERVRISLYLLIKPISSANGKHIISLLIHWLLCHH